MGINLGVVMDPIDKIQFHKDSTLALLLAAQSRGDTLYYMEPKDLYLSQGQAFARVKSLQVFDDENKWFAFGETIDEPLDSLDCILMRQDPPFNMSYIYATYILDLAAKAGCLVLNRPSALRDCNEKMYTTWFPELCSPTTVATDIALLKSFVAQHEDCVVKPLDGMGGASIFRIQKGDQNTNVILDMLTHKGTIPCMIQKYLPEITDGDKRILVFNGQPVDHVVVRLPSEDDFRGNIAAGATTVVRPINDAERNLVKKLGPTLVEKGLYLVGLDVIGDKITEINVTSPTCLRHIEKETTENVSMKFMAVIDALLKKK